MLPKLRKLPLTFEANQGQSDQQVKFLARGAGYGLFLTGNEAVLTLQAKHQAPGAHAREVSAGGKPSPGGAAGSGRESVPSDSVVRLHLLGANPLAPVAGADRLPGNANYFIGNDPSKWRTDVPTYARVRYEGVYPGVDLVYYGNQGGQLEYDFVVSPGADPRAIALAFSGIQEAGNGHKAEGSERQSGSARQSQIQNLKSKVDPNGDLVIATANGDVRFNKPVVYQESKSEVRGPMSEVRGGTGNWKPDTGSLAPGNGQSALDHRQYLDGRYVLDAQNLIRFELGAYDHSKPLIIDPSLTYSTYLGGAGNDYAYAITVDSTGAAYITGTTSSTNFPNQSGYSSSNMGGSDCFVTKLNPSGSGIVYSTYIGGSSNDTFDSISLDSSSAPNEVVLAGYSQSTNFPTLNTSIPNGTAPPGGYNDGIVTKLNANGNGLDWSTYLGGAGDVFFNTGALAVDSSGDVYVGGEGQTTTYPVVNAIIGTNGTSYNGVFSRIHFNGTTLSLVYSSYWGGSFVTSVNAVAINGSGDLYLGGFTEASDFPTSTNAYQTTSKGSFDGFVSELNWNGTALSKVYSTYLGGNGEDSVEGMAIDSSGNAYVTGYTSSTNFPTLNALQTTHGGGDDVFAAALNPTGTALLYSTYIGGSGEDDPTHMVMGAGGRMFIVGFTDSPNYPTANAIQSSCDNCSVSSYSYDAFVTALRWNGTTLTYLYSTYLGGSGSDAGYGIAIDSSENAYVTGYTASSDFPTAGTPYLSSNQGDYDAFVAELPLPTGPGVTLSSNSVNFGNEAVNTTSGAMSVTLTSSGLSALSITSIVPTGDYALVQTGTSCPYTGGSVPSGNSCTIDVTFTPTDGGTRNGTVVVTDDSENITGAMQTIDLTGVATGGAAISFSSSPLNFPSEPQGLTGAPLTETITNTGALALHITQATVGGLDMADFAKTADTCTGFAIAPNHACGISLTFTPGGLGSRGAVLVIYADVIGSPVFLDLNGTGVTGPEVMLTPPSLTFTTQALTTTSPSQLVTLKNTGNAALAITGIAASSNFVEQSGCASSIPAGETCVINVSFAPTASGPLTGTLTITDDSNGTPGSTQTVSLSGTGAAPAAMLSPASLTYQPQLLNTSSGANPVTLTNLSETVLNISSIASTGDFTETSACGSTVNPGASCTISVTFKPTLGGTRSGTLTVMDNAPNSPQSIPLSGMGEDFTITTPSGASTTASVTPGQTANYTLSISGVGGFNQQLSFTCAGVPVGASCNITPNPVTVTSSPSNITVSVATLAPTLVAPRSRPPVPPQLPGFTGLWVVALAMLGTAWAMARRHQIRWRPVILPLVAALLMAMALAGCNSPSPSRQFGGTAAGTSTLTITGSTGLGSAGYTHSVTLTLTVS